jgi:nicotinamidase-related amidase
MVATALLIMDVQHGVVDRYPDAAGIATSGVVLSTLRQAADLDYELVVLRDGCVDSDEEVHRILCDKVFPRQAEVVDVAAWIASLSGT